MSSVALLAAALVAAPSVHGLRILSLDQCADQYVLALAREQVVGLSHRADDPDSRLRDRARGLPLRRASIEAVLGARPDVVVRSWGGDARLLQALERRGVTVVTLQDADDLDGVRTSVRRAATAFGRPERGEALLADMDRRLARARGAWRGQGALYLTPGAYTTGPGTLIDQLMRLTGLRNLARAPGYQPAPTERVVLNPPALVVRGFFDQTRWTRWAPGRSPVLDRALAGRTAADLPASLLACPTWFAGEAAEQLAAGAPRR